MGWVLFSVSLCLRHVSVLLLVGTTFTIPDENDASQSLLFALLRFPFVDKGEVGSVGRIPGLVWEMAGQCLQAR